jgi:hypothetical protein
VLTIDELSVSFPPVMRPPEPNEVVKTSVSVSVEVPESPDPSVVVSVVLREFVSVTLLSADDSVV